MHVQHVYYQENNGSISVIYKNGQDEASSNWGGGDGVTVLEAGKALYHTPLATIHWVAGGLVSDYSVLTPDKKALTVLGRVSNVLLESHLSNLREQFVAAKRCWQMEISSLAHEHNRGALQQALGGFLAERILCEH